MLTFIFAILLVIFFGGLFLSDWIFTGSDLILMGVSGSQIKILLGIGVIICQFGIILFSMLDRIGYLIKAAIRPLVMLIPFLAFVSSAYQTLSPIFMSLLLNDIAAQNYVAQAVEDGSFTTGVLYTLFIFFLLIIVTYATTRQTIESPEMKALREENAKLRKQLKSL